LKETWLSEDPPEPVLTRVSDIKHRLKTANDLAQKHLDIAQSKMKKWYDLKARERVFKSGDRGWCCSQSMGTPYRLGIVDLIPSLRK